MQLQTKYITVDEFNAYFNEDLRLALGGDQQAIGFIKRVEDRLATYLDSNFNRNVDRLYPQFTDYQKEHYKLALLEQTIYIYRNGDISVDSGIDTDKGVIVDRKVKKALSIADNCIDNLRLCGLWNVNVRATYEPNAFNWWAK